MAKMKATIEPNITQLAVNSNWQLAVQCKLLQNCVISNCPEFHLCSDDPRFPANTMINSTGSKTSVPDVITHDLQSLNLHGGGDDSRSFLVLDQEEQLCVDNVSSWVEKLGCDGSSQCKVVSILGNTGEGKSHTLNHTFFNGAPVFSTSNQQESCTTGVWASYDPDLGVIILDTEGMLGSGDNENVRTRMLLKVLAVSDIVIYRCETHFH